MSKKGQLVVRIIYWVISSFFGLFAAWVFGFLGYLIYRYRYSANPITAKMQEAPGTSGESTNFPQSFINKEGFLVGIRFRGQALRKMKQKLFGSDRVDLLAIEMVTSKNEKWKDNLKLCVEFDAKNNGTGQYSGNRTSFRRHIDCQEDDTLFSGGDEEKPDENVIMTRQFTHEINQNQNIFLQMFTIANDPDEDCGNEYEHTWINLMESKYEIYIHYCYVSEGGERSKRQRILVTSHS